MWTYLQGLRDIARGEPARIISPPPYEDIIGLVSSATHETTPADETTSADIDLPSPPPYLDPDPGQPPLPTEALSVAVVDDPPMYDDDDSQNLLDPTQLIICEPPPTYRQRSFDVTPPPTYQQAILESVPEMNIGGDLNGDVDSESSMPLSYTGQEEENVDISSQQAQEGSGSCQDDQVALSFFSGGTRLFSGRPAVRWNRNMCIDRWTSLPTWVVS